jgi:hypothetical protein
LRLVEVQNAPDFYLPAFTAVVDDFFADAEDPQVQNVLKKARREPSEAEYKTITAARRYILRMAGLRK